jgi:CubicO group peptidase (beta-lactamase class C family)
MNRLRTSVMPITRRSLLKLAAIQAALQLADAIRPQAPVPAVAAPDPSITPRDRSRLQPFDTDELEEVVRQTMAAVGVPGVAIGIILDDLVYTRGFGVTNIDHPLPVDEHTLFQIGSITKTFTGTALLRYVDRGAITLDTPITQYLPDLKLADPSGTAGVTLRHLMTHTSGLPANDFRAFGGGDDALARFTNHLTELPLLLPLGFSPSYSNPGVSLEGRVPEVLAASPTSRSSAPSCWTRWGWIARLSSPTRPSALPRRSGTLR